LTCAIYRKLKIYLLFLGKEESEILYSSVSLNDCILCNEEGGICDFSRQLFSFGLYENELHIFGGQREGEVLQDMIVLNLGNE
jgi:hypothetical protein